MDPMGTCIQPGLCERQESGRPGRLQQAYHKGNSSHMREDTEHCEGGNVLTRTGYTSSPRDQPPTETDPRSPQRTSGTKSPPYPCRSPHPRSCHPCTSPRSTAAAVRSPNSRRTRLFPIPREDPKTSLHSHSCRSVPAGTSLRAPTAARSERDTQPAPSPHIRKESESAKAGAGGQTNPAQTVHKQKCPPGRAGSPQTTQLFPRGSGSLPPLPRHPFRVQMLQSLHPHFPALQRRDPFRGRAGR